LERCDVAVEAGRRRQGLEEAARAVRYEFLARVAERVGASYVAVGHHADDNVETVLYRIVRGTHIRGLAGMRPARTLGGGTVLVRPLLSFRRSQIERYLRRAQLPWRTDRTNADTGYRRNFIRHELLPLLRERLNPRADEAILRLAGAAGQTDAFVSQSAEEAIGEALRFEKDGRAVLDAAALGARPRLLQAAGLRFLLERLGVALRDLNRQRLDELCDLLGRAPPATAALPGGFEARREREELTIEKVVPPQPEAPPPLEAQAVTLQCPGRTALPDGRAIVCEVRPFDAAEFEAHCRRRRPGVELVDEDKMAGQIVARPAHAGEVFRPLGAPGRQKVADFLTNLKLPRARREAVRCVCDAKGVVWLAPLRIAERVKVTARTRRVLRISLQADESM